MKLDEKALGAAIIEGSNMAGERLVTQIVTAYLEALGPGSTGEAEGINSPLNACCYRDGCRALESRALAAEAALAAERERCARVVEDWAEMHAGHLSDDGPTPLGRHRVAMNDGYALAAAIRAQGE